MPNIIKITDFEASELDVYARLTENQLINRHEPEKGLFIAESPKVIERALDSGYKPVSLLMEMRHIYGEAARIVERCEDVPIYTADFDVLTRLTGFHLTRGVLCAMQRVRRPSVEEVCAGARRIAVLENIMNPTNIGAIFRSAAALNMDAVLLTPACSDPLYRRAARVSMGTVFQVPWTYMGPQVFDRNEYSEDVCWPQPGVEYLRNLGFKTAAMALSEVAVNITDYDLMNEKKLAIIMGTEGDGLDPETIALSDYTVKIPMAHGVDSLNVAAASAVAFWQLGYRSIEEKVDYKR